MPGEGVAVAAGKAADATADALKVNVLKNIAESEAAREASGFEGLVAAEKATTSPASKNPYDLVYGSRTSVENVTSRGTSIETIPNSNDAMAAADFAALQPSSVKTVSTARGEVSVGKLSDGSTVILRPSKDGRTTIEFQNSNGRTTREIRYGPR